MEFSPNCLTVLRVCQKNCFFFFACQDCLLNLFHKTVQPVRVKVNLASNFLFKRVYSLLSRYLNKSDFIWERHLRKAAPTPDLRSVHVVWCFNEWVKLLCSLLTERFKRLMKQAKKEYSTINDVNIKKIPRFPTKGQLPLILIMSAFENRLNYIKPHISA